MASAVNSLVFRVHTSLLRFPPFNRPVSDILFPTFPPSSPLLHSRGSLSKRAEATNPLNEILELKPYINLAAVS